MKRFISIIMCLVAVASLSACIGDPAAITADEDLRTEFVRSEDVPVYNFTSGEDIIPENYDKFKEGTLSFALNLLAQNTDEDKNLVMSPVSVSTALSVLANGASDDTRTELRNALAGGADVSVINTGSHYLNSRLSAFNSEEGFYRSANALWFNDTFDVKAAFLQTSVNYYDAGIFRIPFSEEDSVDKINGWISENTDGEITDAVDSVDSNAAAMIINTALLDDSWATPYTESQLGEGTFHGAKGDTQATYMTSKEYYISTSYAEGFVKGFENVPCKFAAILPPEDVSMTEFVSNLTASRLTALLDSQSPMEFCTAKIPQFTVESKLELGDSLKALGIEDVFDKDKADFSNLSNAGKVYLSSVTQDAFVEVGPQGARAGAATVASINTTSATSAENEVTLDRPFLFVIYDNESNIPVFLGVVNNVG